MPDPSDDLIRAAEVQPWTLELWVALAMALIHRGYIVSPYDTPGDLADALRRVTDVS